VLQTSPALTVTLYDPQTGAAKSSRDLPDEGSWVVPSNAEGASANPQFDFSDQFALSPAFAFAVGLDEYSANQDTVPAEMDLDSGVITDLVPPSDQSGFDAQEPVRYSWIGVDPRSGDIWALHGLSGSPYNGPGLKYRLEDLTTGRKLATAKTPEQDLYDSYPAATFVRGIDYPVVLPESVENVTGSKYDKNLFFIESDALQERSNLTLEDLVYSDQPGSAPAAFIAYTPDNSPSLWSYIPGKEPRKLTDLGSIAVQTVIYRQ